MRVVILTNEQGNQTALCNKFAEKFDVAAIVLSQNIPKKKPSLSKKANLLVKRLAGRTFGREFVDVWFEMQKKYDSLYPDFPEAEIVRVENVNAKESFQTIEKHKPDLVIVSGTNLVGKKVIKTAQERRGIVNLHTGISPYVKGGPNCTNWCLAKGWFHLIGNTVMWLDLGIDTGNIIATEQTPLDGNESLFDLHWKVMEHAHDIYVRSVEKIAAEENVHSVPQNEIGEGSLFYTADWNARAMRDASRNFKNKYAAYFADREKHAELTAGLKLYPVNDAKK